MAQQWPVWTGFGLVSAAAGLALKPGRSALMARAGRSALAAGPVRYSLAHLDSLDPTAFELAVCSLLCRDGLAAQHVGRAGDKGADVLVVDGSRRRVVVQCKRLRPDRRVGDQDVQRVNGTYRHDHGAEFAVIVTTGGFTAAARVSGPRYGIHLVDRDALERWADLGEPLYRILRIPDKWARSGKRGPGSWRAKKSLG
ncbi:MULTISPECIES: restriction endonuclease [Streptomyces]|uniref:restriction endonuclease n=1 Tax=Streptomyces TaxID=1883 RepID=UPI002553416B|nr:MULTISPECIES: restriction endonuclease [Streptomyces]WSW55036.1 restriction endonuclease [Streptomyces platensis]WSX23348.1 restriction endonuclease [Streptomyces tubercidicus]